MADEILTREQLVESLTVPATSKLLSGQRLRNLLKSAILRPDIPSADRIAFWDQSTGKEGWLQVGATSGSLVISGTGMDTSQDIRTSASPTFNALTLSEGSGAENNILYFGTGGALTSSSDLQFDGAELSAPSGTFPDGLSANSYEVVTFSPTVVDIDGTMAANSDTRLTSQRAIVTYVGSRLNGLNPRASCVVRTTANVSLAGGGIANGTTHDGVVVATGDRVLVMSQSAPAENGIYVVPASGAASRATDMDAWTEVPGAFTTVLRGTTYHDTGWYVTSDPGGTLGSTAITWSQQFGAGTFQPLAVQLTTISQLDVVSYGAEFLEMSNAADARSYLEAAALASPTFTGVPAGPTADAGTNTTQLATTAFVTDAVLEVSTDFRTTYGTTMVGTYATVPSTGGANFHAGTTGNGIELFFDAGRYRTVTHNTQINGIRLWIPAASGGGTTFTSAIFKVWRYNGATFDLVGASDDFYARITQNSLNTITFRTPITNIREGDYYSIFYNQSGTPAANSVFFVSSTSSATYDVVSTVYFINGQAGTTGVNWRNAPAFSTALSGYGVPIQPFGPPPVIIHIGDSLTCGVEASYGTIHNAAGAAFPYDHASTYQRVAFNKHNLPYQNMGISGNTSASLVARFTTDVLAKKPQVCVIWIGRNDIDTGVAVATATTNITSLVSQCINAGIRPVLISPLSDSTMVTLKCQNMDLLNTNLAAIPATYPACIYIDARPTMMVFRAGGDVGNLWDHIVAYNASADPVHFNIAGFAALGNLVAPHLSMATMAVGPSLVPNVGFNNGGIIQNIVIDAAASKGSVIREASAQTGNPTEIQNSAGTVVNKTNAAGAAFVTGMYCGINPSTATAPFLGTLTIDQSQGAAGSGLIVLSNGTNECYLFNDAVANSGHAQWYTATTKHILLQLNSTTVAGVGIGPSGANVAAKLHAQAQTSTQITCILQGAASQSVNLLEVRNSASTVLSKFDAAGKLGVGTGTIVTQFHVFTPTGSDGATIECSDVGANGPILDLYHNSASPAVSDVVGRVNFNGKDSAGNKTLYGAILTTINDPNNTGPSEDSRLDFYTLQAGASYNNCRLDWANSYINGNNISFTAGTSLTLVGQLVEISTTADAIILASGTSISISCADNDSITFNNANVECWVSMQDHEGATIFEVYAGTDGTDWGVGIGGSSQPGIALTVYGDTAMASGSMDIRADGSIRPAELADIDALPDSIYYSATALKLVYKDQGGVVRQLY